MINEMTLIIIMFDKNLINAGVAIIKSLIYNQYKALVVHMKIMN